VKVHCPLGEGYQGAWFKGDFHEMEVKWSVAVQYIGQELESGTTVVKRCCSDQVGWGRLPTGTLMEECFHLTSVHLTRKAKRKDRLCSTNLEITWCKVQIVLLVLEASV
jgi:hypothetical protein